MAQNAHENSEMAQIHTQNLEKYSKFTQKHWKMAQIDTKTVQKCAFTWVYVRLPEYMKRRGIYAQDF